MTTPTQQLVDSTELDCILFSAKEALSPQIQFSPGDSEADMLRSVICSMMDSVGCIVNRLDSLGVNTEES